MRILITGGLGFIGSRFVRLLLNDREESFVTNIDSMSYGSNPSNLRDFAKDQRYRFVRGNIASPDVIRRLIEDTDAVVNFAAETHVDRSISSAESFVKSNVIGVFTILEGLRRVGRKIPFVQVGTDEEYGEVLKGSFREDDPTKPSSPYAATKASASILVLSYARTYGLDAKITRCTNNYGPCQFPEKFVPKSIIRAHLGLMVPVYGDGRNCRDWIHVEDHCEALDLVMRFGKPGNVYNVAGGKELENIEVVKRILHLMNKPQSLIKLVKDRPGHDRRYSLDDTKIKKELGWKPRHNFEDGLQDTVRWYLMNEKWWRPLIEKKTLSPTPWAHSW